jgi:hypothetical protein
VMKRCLSLQLPTRHHISCFVWSFPAPSLSFTIIIHNNKFMLASACTK